MSRDFLAMATPALARRLLLLQQHTKIELPQAIIELAARDRISADMFDPIICHHSEERARAIQFLLDCDMRGIVQANYQPSMDMSAILLAAKLFGKPMISVVSNTTSFWRISGRELCLSDFEICQPRNVDGDWIDRRRAGVLIIDIGTKDKVHSVSLLREFPHSILYQPLVASDALYDWTTLATLLFPMMPNPLVLLEDQQYSSAKHLALFYNTCIF